MNKQDETEQASSGAERTPSRLAGLTKQMPVSEVFRSIPEKWIERSCAALLCLLAVGPALSIAAFVCGDGTLWADSQHRLFLWTMLNSIGAAGLLMGLFLLVWGHYNDRKPLKERLRGGGLPLFLLAMLLWSCLSCAFSTNPELSFWGTGYRRDGLASYFAYAGIFVLASRIKKKPDVRAVLYCFTASAALLALIGLADLDPVNDFLGVQSKLMVFSNQNHYGYYLCMALPAAMWLFLNVRRAGRIVTAAELLLLSNALIKCESLGPLIAAAAAFFAMLVLIRLRSRTDFKRALCMVCASFAVIAASSVDSWDVGADLHQTLETAQNAVTELADDDGETKNLDSFGSGRGFLWQCAIRFIAERPVFGYGPDNLGEAYEAAGTNIDRPHNELLQFAASLGIPALLFYLGGMVCLLAVFIRSFRYVTVWEIGSYTVIGSYLISSLVGNTMFYTSQYFLMLLGLCFSQIRCLVPPEKSAPAGTTGHQNARLGAGT